MKTPKELASEALDQIQLHRPAPFGAIRASRRIAVSAACRQYAEALAVGRTDPERAFSALHAALRDLVELEIEVFQKNRERFHGQTSNVGPEVTR